MCNSRWLDWILDPVNVKVNNLYFLNNYIPVASSDINNKYETFKTKACVYLAEWYFMLVMHVMCV